MLKQSTKRRLLTILLAILLLIAMLGAPARREYSTLITPCHDLNTSSTKPCADQESFITEVHYGLPFSWITLSKTVDSATNAELGSSNVKSTQKIVYNILSWAVIVILFLVISGVITSRRNANTWY